MTPSALPAPIVGCVREPRCWNFAQSTNMGERWTQLMHCTEREILGGCNILGDEASYNRPRMARDTRWWRVLNNRLRELWLMEALPTRRPHLPQQPEQIERLRVHLRRMVNEARAEKDRAEIWEMATQEYGEPELQVLKDVHWRALTVLDKLHKRDRRVREKSIAEYAREASKGAAGLLHRLTKPRSVWCPRDAAQGRRPTRVMRRNWQPTAGHVTGGCTLRSCRMRTGHGRFQTERTCLRCLSSKLRGRLVSMQWWDR